MNSVKRSNLAFMIVLICMIVGSNLVSVISMPFNFRIVLSQYGFILTPVIIYFLITKLPVKETLRLNKLNFKSVLMVFLIALCSMPLVAFIGSISQILFKNYLEQALSQFNPMPLWQWLLVLAVTPAVCEELIMRGVVLGGYRDINIKKAALMNGFLFGIFHLNFNQFFYAFALGVIMAYIVYITNSIFASMIMHFTINGISAVSNWYVRSGSGVKASSMKTIAEYPLSTQLGMLGIQLILAVAFTFIVIKLIKKLARMNNKITIDNSSMELHDEVIFEKRLDNQERNNNNKMFTWPVYVAVGIFIAYPLLIRYLASVSVK